MQFLVLGSVEARDNGISLPVGGPKQRSILALLISRAGQPVSLDTIVDGVYGDEAADGARHSVQTYISAIRRDLGDLIRKDPGGYVLTVEPDAIDAFRFEEAVRSAFSRLEDDPEDAAAALRDALALWRGHPYAGVEGRGIFEPEVTRLSELRLAALEARIDADLAVGRQRELLGELDSLTIEHPLRERFRAQQMVALYRCGRQTEALRAYERTRTFLAEEIGVDPSPELRELEQQILEHDPSLALPAAPSLTQRAVVVVEIADARTLMRLEPAERAALVEGASSAFAAAAERYGGEANGQRGSALYVAFPAIGDAVSAAVEGVASVGQSRVRVAVDFGDVEVHESGEVAGPPVRRSAGIVAAAHPGQILLSAGAHEALVADGESGLVIKSLGTHPIHGVKPPQQVFQLIVEGQQTSFPPLLLDTTPPALPVDRAAVAGYELREPIVSDLSGTTYRAYQPSVGREVVVTAIDPAWANELEFISRFEVETQLVTRLQHPHIVPVLDYWRDPTGAYLVSPSVGGTTLSRALSDTSINDAGWRQVINQVGAALASAHQIGVVHGTISPDAVTLDRHGNAYLAGAGFVVRLSGAPRASSLYAAPEYDRDEPITAAADIYGLGLLAGQLLAEHQQREAALSIAGVVERATAASPEDRFDSVAELLAELAEVLGNAQGDTVLTATRNPYKGLASFGEADADDFYGRTQAVEELAEMFAHHRFVAVVGPSGSGKSSLVRAGLIPAVRQGMLGDSEEWVVTDMFPGSYPFVELESALARVAVADPGSVVDGLDRDEQSLVRVVKRTLAPGTRLLLVIDQFEELFTLTRDDATRERFIRALVALCHDERSEARVVVTLRADFFDRPLQYPEFGALLRSGLFALTALGPAELAEAIRRPAEAVGSTWESGLVERIVDDVVDAPGVLPLLEYALTEVFSARETDEITHDGYLQAGGVVGALDGRADEVFDSLDSDRKALARHLFLRLVAVQSSGEITRRRARLLDLNAVAEPVEVDAVLSAFGDARLVTFDRDPITRGPTVEIAHEAMLTSWHRATDWIVAAREDLLLHQRLSDAVGEWEEHHREDTYLLTGGRLAQFQAWADTTELTPTRREDEFLQLSGERASEEQSRRSRIRNLVTAGFGAAAAIAMVLVGITLLSRQDVAASAQLAHSRELAASAVNALDADPELSLLLAIEAAGTSDPTIETISVVHESLAAHRKVFTYAWPADQEFRQDLSTDLSPDGQRLVAGSGGTYIEVVKVGTGKREWSREFGGAGTTQQVFAQDGSTVVVAYGWTSDGTAANPDSSTESLLGVHVLDASTGDLIRHVQIGHCGVVSRREALVATGDGSSAVLAAEFSDDPRCGFTTFPTGSQGPGELGHPSVSLIALDTGERTDLSDVGTQSTQPPSAILSRDGRFVLLGHDTGEAFTTVVIDRSTGTQHAVLDGWPLEVSADGSVVVTIRGGGVRLTWDLSSGQPNGPLTEIAGSDIVALSPDGAIVAVLADRSIATRAAGAVTLLDTRTGEELDPLLTGLGSYDHISFSADGSRALVDEVHGTRAAVFDLGDPTELASVKLCDSLVNSTGMLEAAGDSIAVHAYCPEEPFPTQFVVDANSYQERMPSIPSGGFGHTLNADGTRLAAQHQDGSMSGPIEFRDTSSGAIVVTMDGLCVHEFGRGPDCVEFPDTPFADWIWSLDFSPDESLLAMGGDNSDAVTVWDTASGQIVAQPTVPHDTGGPDFAFDVAFAPDGASLAASFAWGPSELWLLSTDDWSPIAQYHPPEDGGAAEAPTESLLFTPDGSTLIAAAGRSGGSAIVFMDSVTLEHIGEISDAHDGGITQLALNDEGTLVASSGVDGFARVWDVATRSLVHEIPVAADRPVVGGVAFAADGQHLSVANNATGELRLVSIDPGQLLEIARSRITRAFTDTECSTYHIDPCPTLDELRAR